MSPKQIALSFAVGFSLAWNPFLGLHTAIILLACFLSRRLHRPIMFLACYLNNPWTMVPMATATLPVSPPTLEKNPWRRSMVWAWR